MNDFDHPISPFDIGREKFSTVVVVDFFIHVVTVGPLELDGLGEGELYAGRKVIQIGRSIESRREYPPKRWTVNCDIHRFTGGGSTDNDPFSTVYSQTWIKE